MTTITFDIETNNLLNSTTIDYNASPYKLNDNFKMHCIVAEEHSTGKIVAFYDGETYNFNGDKFVEVVGDKTYTLEDYEPIDYKHLPLSAFEKFVRSGSISRVVGHNIINFDLLATKLYMDLDYTVEEDTWAGNPIDIVDTLVVSKTLNPDRYGGHSLDELSKKSGGDLKFQFRKHIKKSDRFEDFAADMLYYCIYDVKANTAVYKSLQDEAKGWKWDEAIKLEKSVQEIVTRQEHRGFKFDLALAEESVKELDEFMEVRRAKVEPLLPPRPATKKFLQEHTPPANQIKVTQVTIPATQFKGDGGVSANMLKFVEKHGATLTGYVLCVFDKTYTLPLAKDTVLHETREVATHMATFIEKHGASVNADVTEITIFGETYSLPMKREPLKTEMVATIGDTTHIKEWLVDLGWNPTEYTLKDLTVNTKKEKLNKEKLLEAVDRYIDKTLSSSFRKHRCEHLTARPSNLRLKLHKRMEDNRQIKVLTSPKFTVGQEKELCKDLERLSGSFPYVKDIVEYLTYKHRRNSILGGGLDWEEGEEAEKGWLAQVRDDGRIPTGADTQGAASGRMKHRGVANVPRVTSLYGDNMRSLFCVDKESMMQLAFDFDSLEAKVEGHYCYPYDIKGKPYVEALSLLKPNDVHSVTARNISESLGINFTRGSAKGVKYGVTFGMQTAKLAQTLGCPLEDAENIFNAFWEAALPLKLYKEALTHQWEANSKQYIVGLDGRKIPTRAAHAILNSAFQSGGVICAKRAMVIFDKKLKKEGLSIDLFKDDRYSGSTFCQQLIAYHDESQNEVSKETVSWRVFNTEDEAQKFKDEEHKIWSDIVEKSGRFFVGYCRAGELLIQSVTEASEYYNLKVDLTAGYMLGLNWKDCH